MRNRPSHLGAVLDRCPESDGFVVVTIYRGDPERPSSLGPLSKPEVGIEEGDVLTHINGVSLSGHSSLGSLLMGQAGQPVRNIWTRSDGCVAFCILINIVCLDRFELVFGAAMMVLSEMLCSHQ